MSALDRKKRINKFLSDSRVEPDNIRCSISTDHRLFVRAAYNSKKPGQKKRSRAEKSFTMKKNQAFLIPISSDEDNAI